MRVTGHGAVGEVGAPMWSGSRAGAGVSLANSGGSGGLPGFRSARTVAGGVRESGAGNENGRPVGRGGQRRHGSAAVMCYGRWAVPRYRLVTFLTRERERSRALLLKSLLQFSDAGFGCDGTRFGVFRARFGGDAGLVLAV